MQAVICGSQQVIIKEYDTVPMHRCASITVPSGGYGLEILGCYGNESGEFWIEEDGWDRLKSRVNFCPFCGVKAPKQAES